MLRNLFIQIVSAIIGLFVATKALSGVEFNGTLSVLILAGLVLGLLNYFIKPILKTITLPLRIITLNLFTIVISMALLWMVTVFFPTFKIFHGFSWEGIAPLFWTTVLIWIFTVLFFLLFKEGRK